MGGWATVRRSGRMGRRCSRCDEASREGPRKLRMRWAASRRARPCIVFTDNGQRQRTRRERAIWNCFLLIRLECRMMSTGSRMRREPGPSIGQTRPLGDDGGRAAGGRIGERPGGNGSPASDASPGRATEVECAPSPATEPVPVVAGVGRSAGPAATRSRARGAAPAAAARQKGTKLRPRRRRPGPAGATCCRPGASRWWCTWRSSRRWPSRRSRSSDTIKQVINFDSALAGHRTGEQEVLPIYADPDNIEREQDDRRRARRRPRASRR